MAEGGAPAHGKPAPCHRMARVAMVAAVACVMVGVGAGQSVNFLAPVASVTQYNPVRISAATSSLFNVDVRCYQAANPNGPGMVCGSGVTISGGAGLVMRCSCGTATTGTGTFFISIIDLVHHGSFNTTAFTVDFSLPAAAVAVTKPLGLAGQTLSVFTPVRLTWDVVGGLTGFLAVHCVGYRAPPAGPVIQPCNTNVQSATGRLNCDCQAILSGSGSSWQSYCLRISSVTDVSMPPAFSSNFTVAGVFPTLVVTAPNQTTVAVLGGSLEVAFSIINGDIPSSVTFELLDPLSLATIATVGSHAINAGLTSYAATVTVAIPSNLTAGSYFVRVITAFDPSNYGSSLSFSLVAPSPSATATPSRFFTPSVTGTMTGTPSQTPSHTPSQTMTPTMTPTASPSGASRSPLPPVSPSPLPSIPSDPWALRLLSPPQEDLVPSQTPTATPSITATTTPSPTPDASAGASASGSMTASATPSPGSPSATATAVSPVPPARPLQVYYGTGLPVQWQLGQGVAAMVASAASGTATITAACLTTFVSSFGVTYTGYQSGLVSVDATRAAAPMACLSLPFGVSLAAGTNMTAVLVLNLTITGTNVSLTTSSAPFTVVVGNGFPLLSNSYIQPPEGSPHVFTGGQLAFYYTRANLANTDLRWGTVELWRADRQVAVLSRQEDLSRLPPLVITIPPDIGNLPNTQSGTDYYLIARSNAEPASLVTISPLFSLVLVAFSPSPSTGAVVPSPTPSTGAGGDSPSSQGGLDILLIVAGVVGGLVLLTIIGGVGLYRRNAAARRKEKARLAAKRDSRLEAGDNDDEEGEEGEGQDGISMGADRRASTYNPMRTATNAAHHAPPVAMPPVTFTPISITAILAAGNKSSAPTGNAGERGIAMVPIMSPNPLAALPPPMLATSHAGSGASGDATLPVAGGVPTHALPPMLPPMVPGGMHSRRNSLDF